MAPATRRTIIMSLGALTAGLLLALLLSRFVSLEDFKARREEIQALIFERPVAHTLIFILAFALAAALAPGAAVLKVAAGALFGLWGGMAVALSATLLAATIGFLLARY